MYSQNLAFECLSITETVDELASKPAAYYRYNHQSRPVEDDLQLKATQRGRHTYEGGLVKSRGAKNTHITVPTVHSSLVHVVFQESPLVLVDFTIGRAVELNVRVGKAF